VLEALHGFYGFENLWLPTDLFYGTEFQFSFFISSYGGKVSGSWVWRDADSAFVEYWSQGVDQGHHHGPQ
jgi:hypothetical protein